MGPVAIAIVVVLAVMILWQRQRLLSSGRKFGPDDFQHDYEPPDDDADGPSRR